jgi:hypothetical protein
MDGTFKLSIVHAFGECVGGQTHMDAEVDMIGLIKDAFVIAYQIA